MKKLSLLVFLIGLFSLANAQVFHRINAPVTEYNIPLPNPWVGGLNGPQWSAVDLNNDGKLDLYEFDRNSDKHVTFLNIGGFGETKYEFAPQYAANFPPCFSFTLLRDYNRDGIMDLFASSIDYGLGGLKVFTGRYENNFLVFDQVTFPWIFNVLVMEVAGQFTQVPVNATDYPAIDDMDGDGDLDILAPSISGGTVYYYQNMALEGGFSDDTLIFNLNDNCWGKFFIPPFTQSMYLSSSPNDCFFFQNPDGKEVEKHNMHGGATLCTFDEDNDHDKELLYGDFIYPNVIRGKNCGTAQNAWVCEQDTLYPSYDLSVDIPDFPAAFYLDMDNDGLKDLLTSPNVSYNGLDTNVVWFYKNIQSNEFPVFNYKTDELIADGIIDHGTGSNPAFVDYDADGLLDFVVGNEFAFDLANPTLKHSKLFLYKNIGTLTEPAFKLVDDNWLNFSQFVDENNQPYAFTPNFGDLDGDGDDDLIVGERYGRLFYADNLAGPGNPLSFGPIIPFWLGISVGQFSTPFIHDMNKDGLGDLIVGEYKGNINYLPNIGTPGNPNFHTVVGEAPNNEFFGGISTIQPGLSTGWSAPVILEAPDSTMYLITGSELGYLAYYKVIPDSIDVFGGDFELITKQLGELREGKNTHPSFGKLNGDNFFDCIIGNHRGGVGLFSSPIAMDGSVAAKEASPSIGVELYPNPTGEFLFVNIKTVGSTDCQYRIFNSLGQFVSEGSLQQGKKRIDVSALNQGLYFMEIRLGEARVTKRFVKGGV